MKKLDLAKELSTNAYPGRGIVIGKSDCGKYAVTAYFIMGRSETRTAATAYSSRTARVSAQRLSIPPSSLIPTSSSTLL